jgi:hypothetical protein
VWSNIMRGFRWRCWGIPRWLSGQPLADAAISRVSERAADDHTARLGSGPDLAAALQLFHGGDPAGRWLATHPKLTDRLAHLAGELDGLDVTVGRDRVVDVARLVLVVADRESVSRRVRRVPSVAHNRPGPASLGWNSSSGPYAAE